MSSLEVRLQNTLPLKTSQHRMLQWIITERRDSCTHHVLASCVPAVSAAVHNSPSTGGVLYLCAMRTPCGLACGDWQWTRIRAISGQHSTRSAPCMHVCIEATHTGSSSARANPCTLAHWRLCAATCTLTLWPHSENLACSGRRALAPTSRRAHSHVVRWRGMQSNGPATLTHCCTCCCSPSQPAYFHIQVDGAQTFRALA